MSDVVENRQHSHESEEEALPAEFQSEDGKYKLRAFPATVISVEKETASNVSTQQTLNGGSYIRTMLLETKQSG